MKYFKDNENNIFAYEANQEPKEGLVEILEPIVDGKILPQHKNLDMEAPEVVALLEAEKIQAEKDAEISEAKTYLASTDFYMTVDKYKQLSDDRKLELETLREEARITIRNNEGIN